MNAFVLQQLLAYGLIFLFFTLGKIVLKTLEMYYTFLNKLLFLWPSLLHHSLKLLLRVHFIFIQTI